MITGVSTISLSSWQTISGWIVEGQVEDDKKGEAF